MLDVTIRRTYILAGQTIATKVIGDDNPESNGTFFLYTDHLGSTSVLVNNLNSVVAGSDTRHLPFGGYRFEPTHDITDRGYTGHLEARDIGLTYMNARFYAPYINRFLTPDTIIPDPSNPQSYNRYSYARNNPINRIDPTGHVDCGLLGDEHDQVGCIIAPADVYGDKVFLYSASYGYVDVLHALTAIWRADDALTQAEGGGTIKLAGGCGEDYEGCGIGQRFRIDSDLTPDELFETLLVILMRYELRYERNQYAAVGKGTAFSAEDLPSDYLGIISRLLSNNTAEAKTELIDILLALGITASTGSDERPPQPSRGGWFDRRIANREFHPLVVRGDEIIHQEWPEWLQHEPASRYLNGNWGRQIRGYCINHVPFLWDRQSCQ